ncbi:hypothetical protein ACHAPA_010255 [Fusarium lateritium]
MDGLGLDLKFFAPKEIDQSNWPRIGLCLAKDELHRILKDELNQEEGYDESDESQSEDESSEDDGDDLEELPGVMTGLPWGIGSITMNGRA